ncbi:MAG: hypothetical protein RR844_06700 [Clostridium sp.]
MNAGDLAKKYEEYIINLRREFHKYPEVGLNENKTSEKIKNELDKIGISYSSAAYRAEAVFTIDKGLIIPVINDKRCCKIAEKAVEGIGGRELIVEKEKMALGEDFSLYVDKVPGVMAFLGIRNEENGACYPLHHPRFQIDESYLKLGADLHAQYALEFLK